MTQPPNPAVTVTQDVRNAAAEFELMIGRITERDADNIRSGEWDATKDVQWFATLLSRQSNPVAAGVGEGLALRAIKVVTATAKDGPAGLSRIMAIANAAGVKEQYTELLADPDVALIVERPRTEWAHLFKPDAEGCAIPPTGWRCTRVRGHSGPCAAIPEDLHARDALLLGGDAMREKGQ